MENITQEQVIKAYRNAPEAVRAVFNSEETTQLVVGFKDKYGLHIDQAGAVSNEVGYLLLGLINPDKFAERLKNNSLTDQVVNEIMSDINQKIFVPLRKGEEKSGFSQTEPKPAMMPQPVAQQIHHAPLPTLEQPESSTILSDYEEPHIELDASTAPAAPADLPGALPRIEVPVVPAPTALESEAELIAPPPAPAPAKSYSADPYREPVDEPPA